MSWQLILVLGGLAVLITVLMRPDIFLTILRGNRDLSRPKVFRAKSDRDFQATLNTGKPTETKENHHG